MLDHSLQLRLASPRDFDTVRAAVRVYLAWLSSIGTQPHPACPAPMLKSPEKYFS